MESSFLLLFHRGETIFLLLFNQGFEEDELSLPRETRPYSFNWGEFNRGLLYFVRIKIIESYERNESPHTKPLFF